MTAARLGEYKALLTPLGERQMTHRQAFFDKTALHLIKQGKQAYDADRGLCRYRAPDGCQCALGPHIPDDAYSPEMEGKQPSMLANRFPDIFHDEDIELYETLQSVHDGNAFLLAEKLYLTPQKATNFRNGSCQTSLPANSIFPR